MAYSMTRLLLHLCSTQVARPIQVSIAYFSIARNVNPSGLEEETDPNA